MEKQDSAYNVVFFVSTGRCGTQFFADKLAAHYRDLAVVAHEPFQKEYQPRHYFSAYHRNDNTDLTPVIQEHIESIRNTLTRLHYIETGWPVYGMLPRMLTCFQGRVNVVHLYRHPLKVAASLTTHRVYSRGEWSEAMSLSPSDYGVVQSHLAGAAWHRMSEFEKCLFWWTEINHFALELHKRFTATPWLSLRFEEVFSGGAASELKRLTEFLQLPIRNELLDSMEEKTDKYSFKTSENLNLNCLADYPKTIQLMEELGYSCDERVSQEIESRYKE